MTTKHRQRRRNRKPDRLELMHNEIDGLRGAVDTNWSKLVQIGTCIVNIADTLSALVKMTKSNDVRIGQVEDRLKADVTEIARRGDGIAQVLAQISLRISELKDALPARKTRKK